MAKNDSRIVMLLSIIQRSKGAQFINWLKERGVPLQYQTTGSGTASSEMMDFLGLGNRDKAVLISFTTYKMVHNLSIELGKSVGSSMGFGGISMVISPNAFSKITAEIINKDSKDIPKEEGGKMHSEYKYSLILISVNRGFTDAVMQTAKKAGATGGTVIRARLAEATTIEAYADTKLNEEREIVSILAPDSVRNQILEDVNSEFGLKSEAQGTVFSVPVDKVFKI